MAKIMLICGKICVGKSTYSKKLMFEEKAVRLNPDEIMKTICGEFLGDRHEEILLQTLNFIYKKAIEIYAIGINVIIDGGFWQRRYRDEAKQYFMEHNITPEWHYIDINDDLWMKNIEKRNREVESGISEDYYVDQNILSKFSDLADKPNFNEIDIWYKNEYLSEDLK
jgi:predicted kinase